MGKAIDSIVFDYAYYDDILDSHMTIDFNNTSRSPLPH